MKHWHMGIPVLVLLALAVFEVAVSACCGRDVSATHKQRDDIGQAAVDSQSWHMKQKR